MEDEGEQKINEAMGIPAFHLSSSSFGMCV